VRVRALSREHGRARYVAYRRRLRAATDGFHRIKRKAHAIVAFSANQLDFAHHLLMGDVGCSTDCARALLCILRGVRRLQHVERSASRQRNRRRDARCAGTCSFASCMSPMCLTNGFTGGYCSIPITECPAPGGGHDVCPSGSSCTNDLSARHRSSATPMQRPGFLPGRGRRPRAPKSHSSLRADHRHAGEEQQIESPTSKRTQGQERKDDPDHQQRGHPSREAAHSFGLLVGPALRAEPHDCRHDAARPDGSAKGVPGPIRDHVSREQARQQGQAGHSNERVRDRSRFRREKRNRDLSH
jgi:hypothetical protein